MYVKIVDKPISPEEIIRQVKTSGSGCAVTYIGLIRDLSHDKPVSSVEYRDASGTAEEKLEQIAAEVMRKWPVNNVGICHRVGKLCVGDINLVVVVAAAHRGEGFAACHYVIDTFKSKLPTSKVETYTDGTTLSGQK
jgi:molybdopterin synthase catalytic subunit